MPSAASPKIARRDPFLLPLCDVCGGAMNLSSVEPHPTRSDFEIKTFSCTQCGAPQAFDVQRRAVKRAVQE